jgi:hypothetical protein
VIRALALALAVLAAAAAPAAAAPDLESTFQDDDHLIYTTPEGRAKTLDRLSSLGVDRLRLTILWRHIAPHSTATSKPANFDAADPAQYPEDIWKPYDDLVVEAARRGIGVNFNVTGPSPTWANQRSPDPRIQDNWKPDPVEFGRFVRAVGTRYSGSYAPPEQPGSVLPRVDYWTLWNEPNHSGWLTPQWRDYKKNRWVEASPALYRGLVDWGFYGLVQSGHPPQTDTVLIGETAPSGGLSMGYKRYLTALRFIRLVYCVDAKFRPVTGAYARRLGCTDAPKDFPARHPGLFAATGWAHHPYNLLASPARKPIDRDHANIATLGRLTTTLDRVFRRYGATRRFPIYLTEYGYQTPPDPTARLLGITPARAAAWLNQSEYMAWRNPRTRTLAQFLLYDDGAPLGFTFQSGLYTRRGKAKPGLAAYRLPVWQVRRRGRTVTLWGRLRPAPDGAPAEAVLQRKAGRTWRELTRVRTDDPRNFWVAKVKASRRAQLRVAYGGHRSRVLRVK